MFNTLCRWPVGDAGTEQKASWSRNITYELWFCIQSGLAHRPHVWWDASGRTCAQTRFTIEVAHFRFLFLKKGVR